MSEPIPSDEALAKIAWQAWSELDGIEADVIWRDSPSTQERWTIIACALRAALCPPVVPLAPGETVTIPTTLRPSGGMQVEMSIVNATHADIWFLSTRGERDYQRSLDLAGVRQLEATCRRARAALEGDA